MQSKSHPSDRSAFTITECLVVLATTAFILVMPCLAANTNRERINRMVCLNNLRQMGVGSQLYALEDPKGKLVGNLPRAGSINSPPGDDLNWLYGYGPSRTRFIRDLKTFICPATQNYLRKNEQQLTSPAVRVLTDLYDNAIRPTTPGHSYEVMSYWLVPTGFVEKTLQSTVTHRNTSSPLAGTVPGPAMILLMYDAMDTLGGMGVENYPNPYVGHGIEGGNMLFADGHAEWIGTRNWAYRWAVSQDTAIAAP
jgi:prepilin-type processing-associated H-X9-DG protein